jgi:hypothetical protein
LVEYYSTLIIWHVDLIEAPSPTLKPNKDGYRIRLISGNANQKLSDEIADWLGVKLEESEIRK